MYLAVAKGPLNYGLSNKKINNFPLVGFNANDLILIMTIGKVLQAMYLFLD